MLQILREVLDTLHDERVRRVSIIDSDNKTYLVNAHYAVYTQPWVLKIRLPDRLLNRAVASFIMSESGAHALILLE